MALGDAGECHHAMQWVLKIICRFCWAHYAKKEKHYEKLGEDFDQVHESYRKFIPAFVGE